MEEDPPVAWIDVPDAGKAARDRLTVTASLSGGARFYRLINP